MKRCGNEYSSIVLFQLALIAHSVEHALLHVLSGRIHEYVSKCMLCVRCGHQMSTTQEHLNSDKLLCPCTVADLNLLFAQFK